MRHITLTSLFIVACFSAITRGSDLAPGDLIVSETRNANAHGLILDIDPLTGQQQVLASGGSIVQPNGLCLDIDGNIIVADFGYATGGAIVRIDKNTHQQSVVTSGGSLLHPTGVALDQNGQLIVGQQGLSGSVLRINPATGAQAVLASSLGVIEDVVIASDLFIFTDAFQNPGRVYRVNPNTGASTIVSSGGFFNFGPHGICLNRLKANSLLVTEGDIDTPATSSLLDVNTTTGVQTRVSLGGNLIRPSDVAQNSSGMTYVTDAGLLDSPRGLVLSVNLQTGAQTVVASGGNLLTPLGIMVIPEPATTFCIIGVFYSACAKRRRQLMPARLVRPILRIA